MHHHDFHDYFSFKYWRNYFNLRKQASRDLLDAVICVIILGLGVQEQTNSLWLQGVFGLDVGVWSTIICVGFACLDSLLIPYIFIKMHLRDSFCLLIWGNVMCPMIIYTEEWCVSGQGRRIRGQANCPAPYSVSGLLCIYFKTRCLKRTWNLTSESWESIVWNPRVTRVMISEKFLNISRLVLAATGNMLLSAFRTPEE